MRKGIVKVYSRLVMQLLFTGFHRDILRNEVIVMPWFAVVISPTVYVRNLSRPVSVDVFDRRCPFQSVGFPWILNGFLSVENAVEEVKQEHQLEYPSDQRECGNQYVYILKIVKQWEVGVGVVTSWQPGQTDKVHREENPVSTNRRDPEVDVT